MRRSIVVYALVLMVATMAVGCGGDDEAASAEVEQVEETAVPTPSVTRTPRPTPAPPREVPIEDVCGLPDGRRLSVSGYLGVAQSILFESDYTGSFYRIHIRESAGAGDLLAIRIREGNSRNSMRELPPTVFEESDVMIETDEGEMVGVGDAVMIIGTVEEGPLEDQDRFCTVNVETISAIESGE